MQVELMTNQKTAQERWSRFVWTERDIVIIRKGDQKPPTDTQAGKADRGDVRPAAATPENTTDKPEPNGK